MVGNARSGESDWYPINPKTPAPEYQQIERKKGKAKQKKTKMQWAALANKKSLAQLLKL